MTVNHKVLGSNPCGGAIIFSTTDFCPVLHPIHMGGAIDSFLMVGDQSADDALPALLGFVVDVVHEI